jgi:hypothetical protein
MLSLHPGDYWTRKLRFIFSTNLLIQIVEQSYLPSQENLILLLFGNTNGITELSPISSQDNLKNHTKLLLSWKIYLGSRFVFFNVKLYDEYQYLYNELLLNLVLFW